VPELALLGGPKTKSKPFPDWPQYDENERRALADVLESRIWWRTPGTRTLEFERAFAKFHGARHGVAVTNGTAALEVTIVALGIGHGDEVILPDFTFVATASAVLFANALPVPVDVDPDLLHRSAACVSGNHATHQGNHRCAHGRAPG
jgi:3-amino-5-hydroxybenzoate synthase